MPNPIYSDLPNGPQVIGHAHGLERFPLIQHGKEDSEWEDVDEWEDVPFSTPIVAKPRGAVYKYFSGLGDTLLPSKNIGDYVEGPAMLLMAPFSSDARQKLKAGVSEMGTQIVNAHKAQFQKMKDEYNTGEELLRTGHPFDAMMSAGASVGHGLATVTPLVGPAAANAGEAIGNGEFAKGLGQTTGLLAPFGVSAAMGSRAANNVKPSALMTQAVKPGGTKALTFQRNVEAALPALQEASDVTGIKFNSLDNLAKLVPQARQMFWQRYQQMLGPNVNATADAAAVADAMEKQITPRFARLNPKGAAKIRKQAQFYRQNPMTLEQIESELQAVNNELTTYYAKNKVKQAVAARDPEIGHTVAEAEALRDVLYQKLDSLTGGDAANLKRTYGALRNLEEPIMNRQGALTQQAPFDLGDRFMLPSGTGDIMRGLFTLSGRDMLRGGTKLIANRALNQANRSNALINRAYSLTRNPLNPPTVIPSLLAPMTLQATHTWDPATGELTKH